jgi:hypothetical protein
MLYLRCEFCLANGALIINEDASGKLDEPYTSVCPICEGKGFHRTYIEGDFESMRRWSVLRVLDLTYPEHKHRDRMNRLMSVFYIEKFVDDPEMTEDAKKAALIDALKDIATENSKLSEDKEKEE